MKLVPDFQFTPFDEALESSVKWFVENYDTGEHASLNLCFTHQPS